MSCRIVYSGIRSFWFSIPSECPSAGNIDVMVHLLSARKHYRVPARCGGNSNESPASVGAGATLIGFGHLRVTYITILCVQQSGNKPRAYHFRRTRADQQIPKSFKTRHRGSNCTQTCCSPSAENKLWILGKYASLIGCPSTSSFAPNMNFLIASVNTCCTPLHYALL